MLHLYFFFFFNDTATTEIYTLSLHDALPIFSCLQILEAFLWFVLITLLNVTLIILTLSVSRLKVKIISVTFRDRKSGSAGMPRPISYAVFCLKKKTNEEVSSNSAKVVAVAVISCMAPP